MTLFEHLAELRYRLVVAVLWIVLAMIVCALFYGRLYDVLLQPFVSASEALMARRPNAEIQAVNIGVTAPPILALKIVGVAGLIAAAPLWLYQLWAFLAPGLLAKEKKWALLFLAAATPLFLSGVAVGYWVLPKGIEVMLGFTPESVPVANLLDLQYFLTFLIRLMLVFGLAFLLPVVIVTLNLVGVVKARQLASARPFIIFGVFIFGAVATPSTDPFSMLALALPMTVLYGIAEVICRINDKARRRRDPDADLLDL
ncbi:twin-arginine translocase subunit TatC [Granulicoccus sp. GXG6511]|uniref:twin-arginine translocase subunit TatC n=1 Tax=Granulicoccus sp. GXG6511 TaxID=3381351 RepID=UPI003D7C4909